MPARKKAAPKKTARKKAAPKKTARKKAARKKAAPKKAARKKAAPKKTKKRRSTKARRPKRRRPQGLKTVQIGDAVRFPAEARNQIGRYDPHIARGARGAEGIEGIVCSIRDIGTGKLVAKSRGDLSGFVLEVLHHQTFQLHYASDRNTGGPRGPENVKENPTWLRVREVLREMSANNQLVSVATGGLSEEPMRPLLDGWRVVKIKAEYVESAE